MSFEIHFYFQTLNVSRRWMTLNSPEDPGSLFGSSVTGLTAAAGSATAMKYKTHVYPHCSLDLTIYIHVYCI